MKKLILTLTATAMLMPAAAQQYVIVDNGVPILLDDIEKITYEKDDEFETRMLPGKLAADPKTSLFSQALQLTGLADTLQLYWKPDYMPSPNRYYYYKAGFWNEVAVTDIRRLRLFTVFAETDDVYAAQGINNLDDLKAYARQVYDEAFPEDAAVSDPTDRRNSLNRFVAYHILGHGAHYYHLTGYDGNLMQNFYDRDKADIATWYATLMPYASLKCSYPAGQEAGLYLNRRGLKDGPDKYGTQIRGAKLVPYDYASLAGGDIYTHPAFNGYYFYIDRILAYDRTAREQVLGSERWRVDCTTLSPDILNIDTKQRDLMTVDGDPSVADQRYVNHAFFWDIENFWAAKSLSPLIARRSRCNFWDYEGDEMLIFDNFDVTVKLPPLPAGEWEIRLGNCNIEGCPKITAYINGQQTSDEIDLSLRYYRGMPESEIPAGVTADMLSNKLKAPDDCGYFNSSGQFNRFSDEGYVLRSILGRVKSDGKSDIFLRLVSTVSPVNGNMTTMILDFLEFCPVSIADNKEIPED